MTDDARLDFARDYWDSRNHAERRGTSPRRVAGTDYDDTDLPDKDDA